MDVRLTPDSTLPPDKVHVSRDLDAELLASLKESDLDIVVEDVDGDNIRLSPTLLERISEWAALKSLRHREW